MFDRHLAGDIGLAALIALPALLPVIPPVPYDTAQVAAERPPLTLAQAGPDRLQLSGRS